MNGRRVIVGLCMLCALLVSAFAAQSASAVTKGTTAFTCKESGPGGGFTKAHCKAADAGSGNFSHVAIPQDTTTEVEISSKNANAETSSCANWTFKYTLGGTSMETVTCEVQGAGWMENKVDPGGEHYTVSHISLTLLGVKSKNLPGCEAYTDSEAGEMGEKEVIHTEPLKFTTTGQGDSVKIEPTAGSTFARFFLTGCVNSGLNGTYSLTGSFKCKPDGATTICDHTEITTQNTFKLNGSIKAALSGPVTTKGRANGGEPFTPLSTTTVETE
ncbi:MAG TPA: hypothetical protein VFX45_12095 [Solirubrobacterales bacterium]|nr:hypothetical protein [Solirubrobacterales bacterium]